MSATATRPSKRDIARRIAKLPEPQRSIAAEKYAEIYGRHDEEQDVGTFHEYVARNNPTLLRYEHVPRLLDVGQRIVDGELMRVIVALAPRYFKTEIFGRLLPSYFLRKHPTWKAGLASYGAELAWSTSEEARHYYQQDGGLIRRETSAKKHWSTAKRGEMWAAGVGGPLLGFGYHLGIVDDPTDPEKAHSPTYHRRFQDWWPAKWLSRQEPGARIVVDMQRLGPDDPIDFLFRRELGIDTDEAPEHWHVVICDELKSEAPLAEYDGPQGLPPTCTLEPDRRPIGAPLAPSRFSLEQVKANQRAAGSYVAAAQRQQRPSAPTGDFWQEAWFKDRVFDELPANAYNRGKDWDTAYTKDEANAASAYVESARGPGKDGEFLVYITDADFDYLEFPELVYWMGGQKPPRMDPEYEKRLVPLFGPHHIEAKASGKSAKQALQRNGVSVTEVKVEGDKLARAAAVQPVVAQGRVHISRKVYRKLLLADRQGLLRVRAETLVAGGPDIDLNDAFVQAITRHVGTRPSRRYPSTSQMNI